MFEILHVTNNYPTKDHPIFGIFNKEQIDSLSKFQIKNEIFFINGREKGKKEYIKSIFSLHKLLKEKSFDIVHCHHSFSLVILILSLKIIKNQTVTSFQNDPKYEVGKLMFKIIGYFSIGKIFKNRTRYTRDKFSFYLPNGVDVDFFSPMKSH